MAVVVGERQYPVRLPMELFAQVERLAKEEERSLNWMMVRLIREALEARAQKPTGSTP